MKRINISDLKLHVFERVTNEISRAARRKRVTEEKFVRRFKTLRSRKSRPR